MRLRTGRKHPRSTRKLSTASPSMLSLCDNRSSIGRRTGAVWTIRASRRVIVVRRVCELLEQTYGRPNLGNPLDPLDDLVFIMLSNRTDPKAAARAYESLKKRFTSWDALIDGNLKSLRRELRPLGLWRIRAKYLRSALRTIRRDFGACDLTPLRGRRDSMNESYLATLPGVSNKVAKCVVMYTLGAEVLPVDAHVHRVALRLGWIDRKRADQCHDELEELVPPKLRYAFHVDCILHGRAICRPSHPKCPRCIVKRYCAYAKARGGGND
jgi:endonuclease III